MSLVFVHVFSLIFTVKLLLCFKRHNINTYIWFNYSLSTENVRKKHATFEWAHIFVCIVTLTVLRCGSE